MVKGCKKHSVFFEVDISDYEIQNSVRCHFRVLQSVIGIISTVDNKEHCYNRRADVVIKNRYI